MMEVIVILAGASRLADLLFLLIDRIERPRQV